MTKNPAWGGARKGAGRPPTGKAKRRMTIAIEPDLLARLRQAHQAQKDISFSEFVSGLLANYFDK